MKKSFAAALILSAAIPFTSFAQPAAAGNAVLIGTAPSVSGTISELPSEAVFTAFESGGPGAVMETNAGTAAPANSGIGLALDGFYVAPSYFRGDIYVTESCVPDGNGDWVYNTTDAYNPAQDALYKVIREDGDWYVCEYFGNEIWLKKAHCTPVTSLAVGDIGETRAAILKTAVSLLGKPYQYGASGPDSFDCSGFVGYCYNAAGLSVPRSSSEIGNMANITKEQLKPGDILWHSGHVAIYLGNDTIIHAENSGTGVIAEKLRDGVYVGFINAIGD